MTDPATVTVPNVVNAQQQAAEEMLTGAGLVVGTVTKVSSSTVPVGSVIGATPAPGSSVNASSPVDLQISIGPTPISGANMPVPSQAGQVSVPNVAGLTRQAAEAILKNAGLNFGAVTTHHSNSIPDGGVISVNPDVGALVDSGAAVALEVSNGPESNWTQYISVALFALLGFVILGLIVYGITEKDQRFLNNLADKEVARGLITFLIAITTVGVAIILAISTLVLGAGDEGDKRFDRGKQVLSVLIGVLGTIVGFYFGSEVSTKPANTQAQIQSSQQIATASLPDGASNQPYQSIALRTTGLVGKLNWSVSPNLPPDLVLDGTSGTITGTPKAPLSKTIFTFAVTDSATPQVTVTKNLTLEIK
jgi:PASTA domain-containing protein